MKGQKKVQQNEKGLKVFLVSYLLDEKTLNVTITSFTKKEAGDLFIEWAKGKGIFQRISGVVVQRLKKTKRNSYFFTPIFYKRQCDFVKSFNKRTDA